MASGDSPEGEERGEMLGLVMFWGVDRGSPAWYSSPRLCHLVLLTTPGTRRLKGILRGLYWRGGDEPRSVCGHLDRGEPGVKPTPQGPGFCCWDGNCWVNASEVDGR